MYGVCDAGVYLRHINNLYYVWYITTRRSVGPESWQCPVAFLSSFAIICGYLVNCHLLGSSFRRSHLSVCFYKYLVLDLRTMKSVD